jgi:hypothetical protein
MTQTTELEFVNDWSELENAVDFYRSIHDLGPGEFNEVNPGATHALSVIVDYVPRLLTQYASLLELSLTLTEGWEQYASLQQPKGLYLPDHR